MKEGKRVASIIRVSEIERSVVLFPNFGPIINREWTSATVLEDCSTFYVNPFSNRAAHIELQ
jgi:hypothetical protein